MRPYQVFGSEQGSHAMLVEQESVARSTALKAIVGRSFRPNEEGARLSATGEGNYAKQSDPPDDGYDKHYSKQPPPPPYDRITYTKRSADDGDDGHNKVYTKEIKSPD